MSFAIKFPKDPIDDAEDEIKRKMRAKSLNRDL